MDNRLTAQINLPENAPDEEIFSEMRKAIFEVTKDFYDKKRYRFRIRHTSTKICVDSIEDLSPSCYVIARKSYLTDEEKAKKYIKNKTKILIEKGFSVIEKEKGVANADVQKM